MYVDRYFMVRPTALLSFCHPVILVQLLCWWIILVLFNERKLKIMNDDMNEEFSNVLRLKLNIEGDFSIEITRWFYHYVLNKIKKNPVTILTSCQYLTGLINGILHFNNEHIFSCILICIYYLHTPILKASWFAWNLTCQPCSRRLLSTVLSHITVSPAWKSRSL